MIWFFTPYSYEKRLFNSIDQYMSLVKSPDDWACLMDGDTAFLLPDFGHQIKQYVEKYPDTGLFSCYASRCHYRIQRAEGGDMENPDILFHKNLAETFRKEFDGEVKEVNRRVAGHLLVIKKSTWLKIRGEVAEKVRTQNKQILGVDTKISNAVLKAGLKIRLMRGMYIFHYLRLAEGFNSKKHLKK